MTDECSFCENNINDTEFIACKSCSNSFHIPHLSQWLEYKIGCPQCFSKDGFTIDKIKPLLKI